MKKVINKSSIISILICIYFIFYISDRILWLYPLSITVFQVIILLFNNEPEIITEFDGFKAYEIVKTHLGIGVIIKFEMSKGNFDKEYMGALIQYTEPYISYNFMPVNSLIKFKIK